MSDKELLATRVCDLDLDFERTPYARLLKQLHRELAQKNILFRPPVWISDDWFCPDGVSAIAIPFFLMHPRLISLGKQIMGEVEGESLQHFMKLLRHECGHAIDNAFFLREEKGRKEIFGDHELRYPTKYQAKKYSKSYVIHLEDNYAQAHPEEDWAETFATWLTPQSNWRVKYQNWPALKKLNYLDSVMEEIKDTKQYLLCHQKVDSYEYNEMTVGQFFLKKKRKLRRYSPKSSIKHIEKVLAPSEKGVELYVQLNANKDFIKSVVAKKTNQYQYMIEDAFKDLNSLAKNKGIKVSRRSSPKKLAEVAHVHTQKFFKDKKNWILM
jgi:hypothetical protein